MPDTIEQRIAQITARMHQTTDAATYWALASDRWKLLLVAADLRLKENT